MKKFNELVRAAKNMPRKTEKELLEFSERIANERRSDVEAIRATYEQNRIERKQEALERALASSGVPVRYVSKTINEFKPLNADLKSARAQAITYVKNFKAIEAKGVGFVFYGAVGTGKSHLACAVLNALKKEYGVTVAYMPVTRLYQRIQDGFNTNKNVFDSIANTDVLVLDEVGANNANEWRESTLFALIDQRTANGKPTIFISNLNPREPDGVPSIEAALGARAFERVMDTCVFIPFTGKSQRKRISSIEEVLK